MIINIQLVFNLVIAMINIKYVSEIFCDFIAVGISIPRTRDGTRDPLLFGKQNYFNQTSVQ